MMLRSLEVVVQAVGMAVVAATTTLGRLVVGCSICPSMVMLGL